MTANLTLAGLPALADILNQAAPIDDTNSQLPNLSFTSVRQNIVIYYAPAHITQGQIRAVWTALTLCGKADDDRPQAWQTWVFSMAALAFPEMVTMIRGDSAAIDYVLTPLPETFIASAVDAIRYHALDNGELDTFVTFPDCLPDASTQPHTKELAAASEIEGLYAYFAMIVFLLGKSVGPENTGSITDKRPNAIIRKRNLESCAHILTGSGKVPIVNYGRVKSGWARSTRPRLHLIRLLAGLVATEQRSEIFDPVVINMTMLKNANQTYLFHIHDLLRACPWTLEIPAAAAAFTNYARMIRELHGQPEWFRPYYKLAMQDSSKHIKRRGLEALIGIATAFAAQTNPGMTKYRIPEGSLHLVAEFLALGRSKGMTFRDVQGQQTTEVATAT